MSEKEKIIQELSETIKKLKQEILQKEDIIAELLETLEKLSKN